MTGVNRRPADHGVRGVSNRLEKGVLTISLDFELGWGTLDKPNFQDFERLCAIEREVIIDRLLALFFEFNVSATWCVVGHLFLDRCDARCAAGHPEIRRSTELDRLRLDRHSATAEWNRAVYCGRSLVKRIQRCPVPQELGLHSFSHVLLGDPECTRETAESELKAAVEAARELGIEPRSFAFPRNQIGHVSLLPRYGFQQYRGVEPAWYVRSTNRRCWHRIGHLFDILAARTPHPVMPKDLGGVWELPGSMLYTPSFGVRQFIPVCRRVTRGRKGLRAAVREKRIFHLWFHPTDLVTRHESMLGGIRRLLEDAAEMRAKGELDILSMGDVMDRCRTVLHQ